jgi:hypothetical protein
MSKRFPVSKQIIAFIVFIIAHGPGFIPPVLLFFYVMWPLLISGNILLMSIGAFLFPVFLILFLVSEIFSTALVSKILRTKPKEGLYKIDLRDPNFFKAILHHSTYQFMGLLLYYLQEPSLKDLHMRLFGAKIGRNSFVGLYTPEPHLLEVGDNSITGAIGELLTHSTEKGKHIKDGAVVGASSLVPKNKVLGKGKWGGIPVKKLD